MRHTCRMPIPGCWNGRRFESRRMVACWCWRSSRICGNSSDVPGIRQYGYMATRKMSFTIPDDIAGMLLKQVAPRDRSRYVAEAIAKKLAERQQRLIRACQVANTDPD